jgi:S-adenosylmethionine synthetase
MGRSLSDPWSICVEINGKEAASTERQMFEEIIERNLANANETTRKIVNGELNLF